MVSFCPLVALEKPTERAGQGQRTRLHCPQGHLSSSHSTMKMIHSPAIARFCPGHQQVPGKQAALPTSGYRSAGAGTEPCALGSGTITGGCCEHRASNDPRKQLGRPPCPMVLPGAGHTAHTTELTYYHQHTETFYFLVKSYKSISQSHRPHCPKAASHSPRSGAPSRRSEGRWFPTYWAVDSALRSRCGGGRTFPNKAEPRVFTGIFMLRSQRPCLQDTVDARVFARMLALLMNYF